MIVEDISRKGAIRIKITSETNGKSAIAHARYNGSWYIKYTQNGQHKHGFKEYVDILDYLKGKGW